jgi:hypothetical protein
MDIMLLLIVACGSPGTVEPQGSCGRSACLVAARLKIQAFFSPTKSDARLSFVLANDSRGLDNKYLATAYMAIDGVRMDPPVSIPEPKVSLLLGVGLAALTVLARGRANRG